MDGWFKTGTGEGCLNWFSNLYRKSSPFWSSF